MGLLSSLAEENSCSLDITSPKVSTCVRALGLRELHPLSLSNLLFWGANAKVFGQKPAAEMKKTNIFFVFIKQENGIHFFSRDEVSEIRDFY